MWKIEEVGGHLSTERVSSSPQNALLLIKLSCNLGGTTFANFRFSALLAISGSLV